MASDRYAGSRRNDPVLPGQGGQGESGERRGDEDQSVVTMVPPSGGQGDGGESGQGGVGEQDVLHHQSLVDQHDWRGGDQAHGDRREPSRARGGGNAGHGGVEQAGLQHDEQRRARDDLVGQSQQPGHDRRMPGVEDALAALGELGESVGWKMTRPIGDKNGGEAENGDGDQGDQGTPRTGRSQAIVHA